MGQQPSTPKAYDSDSMALLPGDMFRYSLPNVMTLWQNLTGQDAGQRFAPAGVSAGSPRQHLIYEGQVVSVTQEGGARYYSYTLTKVWGAADPQNVGAPGTFGPWASTDSQMMQFFGSQNQPPAVISTPAPQGGSGNFGSSNSLIPQFISENDPNFAPRGSFSALRPADIYKFLDEYSSLILSRISRSHQDYPKILEGSKRFGSNDQIKQTMDAMYTKYMNLYANTPVTVVYEDGKETMTAKRFVDTTTASIVAPKTTRSYVKVAVDYETSYTGDYEKIKKGRNEYALRVASTGADQSILPDVGFRGDVIKSLTTIPLVDNKFSQGYTAVQDEIATLKRVGQRVAAWTQVMNVSKNETTTHFFSQIFPKETRQLPMTANTKVISGTVKGMESLQGLGQEWWGYAEPASTTIYKSPVLMSNLVMNNEQIFATGQDYISMASLILAFERLNPDKMGYDQSLAAASNGGNSVISVDRAWRLSEFIKAMSLGYNRAVRNMVSNDTQAEKDIVNVGDGMSEGFSNREYHPFARDMGDADSPLDKATLPQREALMDAMEKRDAITVQLATASTDSTTQMVGFFVALGVFAGISLLPSPM